MRGKFITFEGSEGSGKSTQARLLYNYLKKRHLSVYRIREPGSTIISEKIRRILLDPKNKNMSNLTEMLLYMAARAQLVQDVILPQLRKGKVVICDRFLDATLAYQGYGHGIDIKLIKRLGEYATLGIKPDMTFFLDIDVEKGLRRTGRTKDRIERRSLSYHEKVRRGYLRLARTEPWRIKVIKAKFDKDKIQSTIRSFVDRIL
jgi:dTMP kinase